MCKVILGEPQLTGDCRNTNGNLPHHLTTVCMAKSLPQFGSTYLLRGGSRDEMLFHNCHGWGKFNYIFCVLCCYNFSCEKKTWLLLTWITYNLSLGSTYVIKTIIYTCSIANAIDLHHKQEVKRGNVRHITAQVKSFEEDSMGGRISISKGCKA